MLVLHLLIVFPASCGAYTKTGGTEETRGLRPLHCKGKRKKQERKGGRKGRTKEEKKYYISFKWEFSHKANISSF